jgi:NAD(P)-dependent dehydrogenase (short-subunit alcohol dehydrogenase family)
MTDEMRGKLCLITGASSGIGFVTALALAKKGAAIFMVCRNKGKAKKARAEIIQASGNLDVEILWCDLASQKQIRDLAAAYKSRFSGLHLLLNDAAVVPRKRTLTEDGIETQFAVNHLAYFLLTNLLLEELRAAAPSRVVNVSSGMYARARLDFDSLQAEKTYKAMKHYALTKLLNIFFTYELARRLEGTGVTANCLAPGFTATDLGRDFSPFSRLIMKIMAHPKEEGAETVTYLASSPEIEGVTGKYFAKKRDVPTTALTHDRDAARRIWEFSEKLTGLA